MTLFAGWGEICGVEPGAKRRLYLRLVLIGDRIPDGVAAAALIGVPTRFVQNRTPPLSTYGPPRLQVVFLMS